MDVLSDDFVTKTAYDSSRRYGFGQTEGSNCNEIGSSNYWNERYHFAVLKVVSFL
jgi:hypothetical protein